MFLLSFCFAQNERVFPFLITHCLTDLLMSAYLNRLLCLPERSENVWQRPQVASFSYPVAKFKTQLRLKNFTLQNLGTLQQSPQELCRSFKL